MQSTINLNDDITKRLNDLSLETGIKVDEIVNNILDNNLDDFKIKTRTSEALHRVEMKNTDGLSKDEFIKEMDSW